MKDDQLRKEFGLFQKNMLEDKHHQDEKLAKLSGLPEKVEQLEDNISNLGNSIVTLTKVVTEMQKTPVIHKKKWYKFWN